LTESDKKKRSDMKEEHREFLESPEYRRLIESYERRQRYLERPLGPLVHWFFVQGVQALQQDLYLPGVASLILGIESSTRVTMKEIEGTDFLADQDLGKLLSNSLLRDAKEAGLPVWALAFPGEKDFEKKLQFRKPHVEIVRVRHDLAHGNVLAFVNEELGADNLLFTPECLRDLSNVLEDVCDRWTEELTKFRAAGISEHLEE
jgi:hypothetical protein